jgi:hypothetical protein
MESGGPRLGLHADTGRRGLWCGRRGGSRVAGQAQGGGRRSGMRSLLRRVREDSRTPDPWLNGRSPTYPDPTVDIASSPDRTASGLAGYVDPLPAREKTQLSYCRDRDSITILLWDPPKSTWERRASNKKNYLCRVASRTTAEGEARLPDDSNAKKMTSIVKM